MRTAQMERNTNETQIRLTLNVDGRGQYQVDTGCGFLNHMLELFARHGSFDLEVTCQGDTQVDDHHTVEDIGIALGKAFAQALGDLRGVYRYGNFLLPMDEALVLCAVDLSGRGYLGWQMELPTEKVGTFDTELAEEFWIAFSRNCGATLHFQQMAGRNSHHILEAAFKGMGRALRQAVAIEPGRENEIPSTKGIL
jgi:imidazoleglycerol-phosphate dehydratase